ncbi:Ada metal-binding domain-containing protein [Nocardioides marmoribigeumensis]|uniref:DNA-3-methyladenine glycosylase II n=1 Tax=Nocardioides marmoribigeumensis TaxID=433649 RepID=A0ABU2BSA5_9ACTN|nr:Ada metal-binding domain-containing protein [Nocardioides marmoribigeumensis]MDR7361501.1 AraC family transcriptional regulator of adaptative response / DNA-3-methyladenine glycosylase II [Nocardioides marmoribigeumensis]
MELDHDTCYRAVAGRDRRFDGVFFTAVHSTGIYCRPSCPARTPKAANVSFHRTAASAQAAGFRACKRCLPGASPGSPEWDVDADVAGRAMRLIADGLVEREGVEGLASRLGFSTRHLTRLLGRELGAGPLALARAQRAQHARTLVERTEWPLQEVAFAAGFASVRQFNDTIREVYAATPTELRALGRQRPAGPPATGAITLQLAVRTPYDLDYARVFAERHVAPGLEAMAADGTTYVRALRLPHGPATVTLDLARLEPGVPVATVPATLRLTDLRDLAAAVERCRRFLDADADPLVVTDALGRDELLAPLVARRPGIRVPGAVDGDEVALRTVLGQQVTLTSANRLAALVAETAGEPLPAGLRLDGVERTFPTSAAVAALDPDTLPMPRARARALVALAEALAEGHVVLDRSADREETRARLLALPGIGPWTADYVLVRALGDPDRFLPTDVAAVRAAAALPGGPPDRGALAHRAESWRPWRSYALHHLWATILDPTKEN